MATMQISAQDNFFASEPINDATNFLNAMKKGLDASLSAPHAVTPVKLGELDFARLDYSGAGLSHIVFATEIRCHTLIFSITASRDAGRRDAGGVAAENYHLRSGSNRFVIEETRPPMAALHSGVCLSRSRRAQSGSRNDGASIRERASAAHRRCRRQARTRPRDFGISGTGEKRHRRFGKMGVQAIHRKRTARRSGDWTAVSVSLGAAATEFGQII